MYGQIRHSSVGEHATQLTTHRWRPGLGWVGLGWVGLGWVGLGWVGLGWVGLENTKSIFLL